MHPPRPLPAACGAVFLVREVTALGVPLHRLRARTLHTPTPGVRTTTAASSVADRARAFAPTLPHDAMLSHETAACLLGLPLPARLDRTDRPLHVMTPTGTPAVRRAGVIGHRGAELRTGVPVSDHLRVTSRRDTWLDLAPHLSLEDLVILGDAVVGTDADELLALRHLVRRSRGIRGVVRARDALDLVRLGSRSPRESLTRVIFAQGGLPEPELNADVLDEHGGWLAQVDFLWREQRVIVEYDGEVHADATQRRKDAQRRRQLIAAGWRVIVLTRDDIPRRAHEVVRDVAGLLAA
ncbi:endonuclease domain-containing protein [Luteipulveratus halotolerans]|uniref:endonuclease domain-containing protein n=1 Tax=Luteipulveratus halotolerans TaxID=1631356 RepID=UPI0006807C19|nr:DUF559 domain-containing protein [Luteipulveratus halotolerans]